MDPNSAPTSAPPAGWNPAEKSGINNQPPPYHFKSGADSPPPQGGYPNQSSYPPGQNYGAQYGQPYQGAYQGMYAGQPAVVTQPAKYATSGPLAQPLPDYLGFSIFTLLCCCLPLGIAALVFSINTRDANMSGNRAQAERSSHLARVLNNTALGIGVAFIVIYIVLIIVMTITAH